MFGGKVQKLKVGKDILIIWSILSIRKKQKKCFSYSRRSSFTWAAEAVNFRHSQSLIAKSALDADSQEIKKMQRPENAEAWR